MLNSNAKIQLKFGREEYLCCVGETNFLNPVVSLTSEGGRIYLILVAILLTSAIHFDYQDIIYIYCEYLVNE